MVLVPGTLAIGELQLQQLWACTTAIDYHPVALWCWLSVGLQLQDYGPATVTSPHVQFLIAACHTSTSQQHNTAAAAAAQCLIVKSHPKLCFIVTGMSLGIATPGQLM